MSCGQESLERLLEKQNVGDLFQCGETSYRNALKTWARPGSCRGYATVAVLNTGPPKKKSKGERENQEKRPIL